MQKLHTQAIPWCAIILCASTCWQPAFSDTINHTAPIKIGVLAFRPKPQTQMQWEPLAKALKRAIPEYDFVVEALTFPELEAAIANQRLDFAITNPSHYVLMVKRNGLSAPLATLLYNEGNCPSAVFGGLVVTRTNRADINTLEDLRDKTIATVGTSSFGGYQAQAYALFKAGIQIPADARLLETGMPHDLVVQAVLRGQADAGFVRTSVLEGLAQEGKVALAQLKILNRQEYPNFPFLVSTPLYPEWPFAVLKKTDENLSRRVAAALFLMDENKSDTEAMGICGFTTPADYAPVEELLRELRQPPFEAAPRFTYRDVWQRYQWYLLGGLFAGGIILFLSIRLLFANRRLSEEHRIVVVQTQQLRESEIRFRTVADFTFDWEYWQGPRREIIYMTPSCERVTGYSSAEFTANPSLLQQIVHPEDRPLMKQHLCDISYQQGSIIDFRIVRCDGDIRWISHHCRDICDENGAPKGRRVSNRDITDRKRMEIELRELATTDALTGLANRRCFFARMQEELERTQRSDTQNTAVLMLDIDHFKDINDTYGHPTGDVVLQHVATLMRSRLRKIDTVGRIGGEEFAIILPCTDVIAAQVLAERLRHMIADTPLAHDSQSITVTVSIGIASMSIAGDKAEVALSRADEALYRAKHSGRNRVEIAA